MSSEKTIFLPSRSKIVIKDLQHANQNTIIYISSRKTESNEASMVACLSNGMNPTYDVIVNDVWRKSSETQTTDFSELKSTLTIDSAVKRSASEPQYYGKNCIVFDFLHCLCCTPTSEPAPTATQTIVRIRLVKSTSEEDRLHALGVVLDNLPDTIDLSSVAIPYDFGVECDCNKSKPYRELVSSHHMFKNTSIVFHRR